MLIPDQVWVNVGAYDL